MVIAGGGRPLQTLDRESVASTEPAMVIAGGLASALRAPLTMTSLQRSRRW